MSWKSWRTWTAIGLKIGSWFVRTKPVSEAMERGAEELMEEDADRKSKQQPE